MGCLHIAETLTSLPLTPSPANLCHESQKPHLTVHQPLPYVFQICIRQFQKPPSHLDMKIRQYLILPQPIDLNPLHFTPCAQSGILNPIFNQNIFFFFVQSNERGHCFQAAGSSRIQILGSPPTNFKGHINLYSKRLSLRLYSHKPEYIQNFCRT